MVRRERKKEESDQTFTVGGPEDQWHRVVQELRAHRNAFILRLIVAADQTVIVLAVQFVDDHRRLADPVVVHRLENASLFVLLTVVMILIAVVVEMMIDVVMIIYIR